MVQEVVHGRATDERCARCGAQTVVVELLLTVVDIDGINVH